MTLFADEVMVKRGELVFPGDPLLNVCPSDALSWDPVEHTPSIEPSSCIGCGLCVSRCPYGAISLTNDGIASVETGDPDSLTEQASERGPEHLSIEKSGAISGADAKFLVEAPKLQKKLGDAQIARLTRNFFVQCGIAATVRRKGDVNLRMDGLLKFPSGQTGAVEIEMTESVIEAPRALLEDVAVLHGRYEIPTEEIVPVNVLLALPSRRSEYFQVIHDIADVLDVHCRTLTLGILTYTLWHFGELNCLADGAFDTSGGGTDLRVSLGLVASRGGSWPEPYLGAFVPTKSSK